jgi:hypothetical protein
LDSGLSLFLDRFVCFYDKERITVEFLASLTLTLLELIVSVFGLFSQLFVEVSHFFVFLFKLFISVLRKGVNVALQILSRFFDFKLKLVLEGKQSVIGALGLIGDILFAALYFSLCDMKYL